MAAKKKTSTKAKDEKPVMALHLTLGSFLLTFHSGSHFTIGCVAGSPITFFNVRWYVWQDFELKLGHWQPKFGLGSGRADGRPKRADRANVSKAAEQKITAALVRGIEDMIAAQGSQWDEFCACLEEADKRDNMRKLAQLRSRAMELEAELEDINQRIAEIERFTI